ncbi:MAG: tetratricopeptide repeat protein [Duncaniella sp.]|nr:tetratricopeptide repeat protein [Duncaniella sp.]
MKKICVVTLGLIASMSLSAQVTLVKEAEKAVKGANTYAAFQKAVETLKPAFTDAETMSSSQTYWIPGKQAFKLADEISLNQQLGKDVNVIEMGNLLLDGYNFGLQALATDTVIDAKGKVKTKLSKEVAGAIAGHLNDFMAVGSAFWDAREYNKAYDAFSAYLAIPENSRLGTLAPKALPDSTAAQMQYYRGLAAWQAEMLPEAAEAFEAMMAIGYNDMAAYDYAYSVAYQMEDEAKKLEYSQIAFDRFGSAKPDFLQRIIQSYISTKDYDKAMNTLQNAISADPNNANYYYLLGVLYDDQNDKEKSKELFKKALDLDSEGAMYNFSYGTAILQEAERLDEATNDMSQADYNKFAAETRNPMLREAASYLEKAYQLDEENMRNALNNLKLIYYNLNDGDNLKRIETLLL